MGVFLKKFYKKRQRSCISLGIEKRVHDISSKPISSNRHNWSKNWSGSTFRRTKLRILDEMSDLCNVPSFVDFSHFFPSIFSITVSSFHHCEFLIRIKENVIFCLQFIRPYTYCMHSS